VDFKKVKGDGILAIIAKATTGATGIDPTFAKFRKAVKAPGLNFLWGTYHFGTAADPQVQVEHYLQTAQPAASELVALDFEPNPQGPSMTLAQGRDFVGIFQARTGRYPVLYGGAYLKELLGNHPDPLLSLCPLWISQYGPVAVIPPAWKRHTLWQYTDGSDGPPCPLPTSICVKNVIGCSDVAKPG